MSRFEAVGNFVYEKGDRIGCTPAEAAVELARKLNAYQMRVERFKAEVERLTAIVGADAIDREHGMCCDSSAKVEQLIKAGDLLGSALILFELKSEEERQERLENWAAAKYGKKS